MIDIDSSLKI